MNAVEFKHIKKWSFRLGHCTDFYLYEGRFSIFVSGSESPYLSHWEVTISQSDWLTRGYTIMHPRINFGVHIGESEPAFTPLASVQGVLVQTEWKKVSIPMEWIQGIVEKLRRIGFEIHLCKEVKCWFNLPVVQGFEAGKPIFRQG